MPHYQPPPPEKANLSPTNSPYSSVDATNNYANNNSQQYSSSSSPAISAGVGAVPTQQNMINNNPKYQQPPNYNGNGNVPAPQQMRTNGGMPVAVTNQQMQQQLQQKYYDQYENQSRINSNGSAANNGMSQSTYSSKPYGQPAPQQQSMTTSYNQQLNYNNHYNSHHQNGGSGGKITDFDPMTGRQNQTLIYSSDRAASKYKHQEIFTH
jgi:hypothetical protein